MIHSIAVDAKTGVKNSNVFQSDMNRSTPKAAILMWRFFIPVFAACAVMFCDANSDAFGGDADRDGRVQAKSATPGASSVEGREEQGARATAETSAVTPATTPSQKPGDQGAAQRGYELLTETPLLPSDFNQETFDALWTVWPKAIRDLAETASPVERNRIAFERYGLTTRPDDDSGKPLQYVVDDQGNWTMNCFSCHGGTVYGKPTPGAPNNRFALQTLVEEIRETKISRGQLPGRMELAALFVPLGTTNGSTNAVVFGMGLLHRRDKDLNLVSKPPRLFTNHDMDAPPWWHFHKRPNLYIDGFASKGHRLLMQFTLVPENGPDFYHEYEDRFRDVYAYLSSLRPPKFDRAVDTELADRGKVVFNQHCADCHGRYDEASSYPNLRIPIDELGTDSVRLRALTVEGRKKYSESWFAHGGTDQQHETEVDPSGYVAPPLDGIWASAPYFHNGSVPTLWHVLHPRQRPKVWRSVSMQMDEKRIGLTIEELAQVPEDVTDAAERRNYFDTGKFGKSSRGHDYPSELSETERSAVLEYLKTI